MSHIFLRDWVTTHQIEIFGRPAYVIKSFPVLSVHEQMVFKFLACLVYEKNKHRFLFASLKSLTTSKNKPHQIFIPSCLLPACLLSRWSIFSSVHNGRLSEQVSGSQAFSEQLYQSHAALGRPEQAS
jgi:hypothetical protein